VADDKDKMWIFGYGSLVWKADFPYDSKIVGYIKGYERKFWQASIDHRGVPGKPGRVVTLVPSNDQEAKVWGTAYKIHANNVSTVLEQLDLREVMGYEKVPIDFHPVPDHALNSFESHHKLCFNGDHTTEIITQDVCQESQCSSEGDDNDNVLTNTSAPFAVTMYYGNPTNDHFVGPAPLEEMARQILESEGLSGRNIEYLYNLADAMRNICEEALDLHLRELESKVRDLESLSCDSDSPHDR